MPPTTSSVTSECALSYSAATCLNVMSSLPALQPTHTVSFVGPAWRAPIAAVAIASPRATASAAAMTTRFIPTSLRSGVVRDPYENDPTTPGERCQHGVQGLFR